MLLVLHRHFPNVPNEAQEGRKQFAKKLEGSPWVAPAPGKLPATCNSPHVLS